MSSLAVISQQHLLSTSGDKTLKLWNLNSAMELNSVSLEFVPISMKAIATKSTEGFLCISSTEKEVTLYAYTVDESSSLTIDELCKKDYTSDVDVSILNKTFYIKYLQESDGSERLLVDKVSMKDSKTVTINCIYEDVLKILKISSAEVKAKMFKPFEISTLFKNTRGFDNVKQYIDRKKARIENHEEKKKKKQIKN